MTIKLTLEHWNNVPGWRKAATIISRKGDLLWGYQLKLKLDDKIVETNGLVRPYGA
jgi:hypothetical protein